MRNAERAVKLPAEPSFLDSQARIPLREGVAVLASPDPQLYGTWLLRVPIRDEECDSAATPVMDRCDVVSTAPAHARDLANDPPSTAVQQDAVGLVPGSRLTSPRAQDVYVETPTWIEAAERKTGRSGRSCHH